MKNNSTSSGSMLLRALVAKKALAPAPPRRPTIGLVMIVRDEEKIIERCLDSVKDSIDCWLVCDTGSKDRTKELVSKKLAGIRGRIQSVPWKNFGHNRTIAIQLARGMADYLLFLGANMELRTHASLPPLAAPAYLLELRTGAFAYRLPLLLRGDVDWRYEGATHEVLYPAIGWERLDAWAIDKHLDGARNSTRFLRDAQLLEEELAEKSARTIFYLAQTYKDLGRPDKALGLYRIRAELAGGFEQEGWYAHWQWGAMLIQLGRLDEAARVLWAAYRRRPTRVEPLRSLIDLGCTEYRELADSMPVPDDLLFLHLDQYAAPALSS